MKFLDRLKPKNSGRPACERLPTVSVVLFAITGACVLLSLVFRLSPAFSDFFNRYVSQGLRRFLAALTSPLPFSLAEILLMLSPALLVLLIVYALRTHTASRRAVGMYLLKLISGACVFFILFVTVFGAGYYGTTLSAPSKLDLDRRDVSAQELYDTGLHLVENIQREQAAVTFENRDFSIMPYTQKEMNQKLLDAYETFCGKHDFIATFNSRVKPVILSRAMSYTHITGVYSYFTGEANLNVYFPDYTLPFTAAHELAHQRGIAREDEANFMAFLACTASKNTYIRYAGYLNLYEYVAGELWSADHDLYREVHATLSSAVRGELKAYSRFFDQYRDSVAGSVSESVNDTFLTIHGTEGVQSYGMVVDLAVAYLIPKK